MFVGENRLPSYHKDPQHTEYDNNSAEHGWMRQSPCKCRPDTGHPCPLLHKDKNNEICFSCGFIGNAVLPVPVAQILQRMTADKVAYIHASKGAEITASVQEGTAPGQVTVHGRILTPRRSTDGLCVMDGCDAPFKNSTATGDFCSKLCRYRCYARLKRANPGEVLSDAYLYCPPDFRRQTRLPRALPQDVCQFPGCNAYTVAALTVAGERCAFCRRHYGTVKIRMIEGRKRGYPETRAVLLRPWGAIYKPSTMHSGV
jgi:hypothetical protein